MINTTPTLVPCIYENAQDVKSVRNVIIDHLLLSANNNERNFKAAVISRVRNKNIVINYYK